ncbi:MAG: helix-turn-helix domain-containing protein [Rubrobacteraceae bacterium]
MLQRYRRDDGSKWGGKSLERATKGYVSHQYVGHLKAGRIKEPSFGKIYAISRAMGIPLEEWLDEPVEDKGY